MGETASLRSVFIAVLRAEDDWTGSSPLNHTTVTGSVEREGNGENKGGYVVH